MQNFLSWNGWVKIVHNGNIVKVLPNYDQAIKFINTNSLTDHTIEHFTTHNSVYNYVNLG